MATGLLEQPMAKKTDLPKRNDSPVKIDTVVLIEARIAAAYKGLSLAEYLSETLRPIVARDIEEQHAQRAKSAGKPKGTK